MDQRVEVQPLGAALHDSQCSNDVGQVEAGAVGVGDYLHLVPGLDTLPENHQDWAGCADLL